MYSSTQIRNSMVHSENRNMKSQSIGLLSFTVTTVYVVVISSPVLLVMAWYAVVLLGIANLLSTTRVIPENLHSDY